MEVREEGRSFSKVEYEMSAGKECFEGLEKFSETARLKLLFVFRRPQISSTNPPIVSGSNQINTGKNFKGHSKLISNVRRKKLSRLINEPFTKNSLASMLYKISFNPSKDL
jgi:hypothetical protein